MLNTPNFTPGQMHTLRRVFHAMNYFMVFMWKMGMGHILNGWPGMTGRIMIIRHRGRRSGKEYLTPVNYAIVNNEIYCTAGFGPKTDWYRNILTDPCVELWLPGGQRRARGDDVSSSPQRVPLLRKIMIASGFAAPLFGVNQSKLTDEQIATIGKDYRLVHFQLEP